MEFWEHKTELFWFLSLTEGIEVVGDSINDYVWEAQDDQTGALNDEVESSDWICLWMHQMSLPMKNSILKKRNIKNEKT